jgi:hypothetical protein
LGNIGFLRSYSLLNDATRNKRGIITSSKWNYPYILEWASIAGLVCGPFNEDGNSLYKGPEKVICRSENTKVEFGEGAGADTR